MFITVMHFILFCIAEVVAMLFSIKLFPGVSLGLFMTVLFIFMPWSIGFLCMLKDQELSYQVSELRKDIFNRRPKKENKDKKDKSKDKKGSKK